MKPSGILSYFISTVHKYTYIPLHWDPRYHPFLDVCLQGHSVGPVVDLESFLLLSKLAAFPVIWNKEKAKQ